MNHNILRLQQLLALLLIAFFSVACETEITLDFNESETQVVIEGAVTNAPGPQRVKISQTINLSETTNYPPVSGALVEISDDLGLIDTLIEATPGNYQTQQIVGMPGHTYTLRVTVNGKTTTAASTMPMPVNLDSIVFNAFEGPRRSGGFVALPVFLDPPIFGNNYRFVLTVNGKKDATYIVSNDNFNNGQLNQRPIVSQASEILAGDSVEIEMRCLDLVTYNYYYTLSQVAGGGPGGGATPSNPPSNLVGENVVGLFAAYTTQSRLQIAQ